MELTERLEWFMKMLWCKYPVDMQEYDSGLTPRGDLADDRTRVLHKLLAGGGGLEQMRAMMEEPGTDMVVLGGNVGLLWGAVCLRENGVPQRYFVLGPVMGAEIDLRDMENELQAILNRHGTPDPDGFSHTVAFQMRLSELLASLPVVNANKFTEDIVMFGCCITGQSRPRSDVAMASLPRRTPSATPQPRHKSDRHRTWMVEQARVHMVREGNLDYEKVLEQSARVSDGVPVKVRDSLQQAKVSGITLVTLCVRAAISGGLTPDAAYTVGDSYIQQIMDCRTLPEIAATNHTMYDDFVHRVHKIRRDPAVSPKIRQCMDYMELHTEEEVSIEQLAAMTGYTEYYLSRKFKEETHCSVNDYSKITRVERAKVLLYTTNESTSKIADRLHFCSGSYFAREFKKYTGQTPAEYRAENTK
ncbi:helix-turn-helix domain-containing protein [Gemmiger sp.]